MRREVLLCAALGAVLSSLPGCSLAGLDRFEWPGCDQCDALNTRDGTTNACQRWQCDAQTQQCRFGPLDEDGDGRAPLRCGGDDCDDTAASAYPGALEICNGVDDDCNGWIDDASADAAPGVPVLAAPQAPSWVSSAPVSGGLIAAYQTAGGAGVEVIDDTARVTPGAPLVLASSAPPYATTSAAVVDGCANAVETPRPLPRCEGPEETCPAGQVCVTSVGGDRLCGTPLASAPLPEKCHHDAECDDGVLCNGAESCQPESLARDPFGCRANVAPACSAGEVCVEAERVCARVSPSASACAIADATLADAGGGQWVTAATTDSGCATGALRLGYFVESPIAPESRYPVRRAVQRGDAAGTRSSSWLGIDVTATERCPGPDTGRDEGAPEGVAGPSIAALPADLAAGRLRPQALVAYLAGPVCRALGTCSDDPRMRPAGADGPLDVELVGVWLEEGTASGEAIGWVTAAGSGAPVRLGVESGAGATRTAVASWRSGALAGYLVAYPRAGGGVALHTIAAMSDPAPSCPATEPACDDDGDCSGGARCRGNRCQLRPCVSTFDPQVTQLGTSPRVTPALEVPAAAQHFAGATITGDVVVAVGRAREGTIELALAWAEASSVAVALATLDPASGVITEGAVQRFPSSAARALAITHVDAGLVREGAELEGAVVDASQLGGFVVTWRTESDSRAVRIADLDGSAVAPGAVVVAGETAFPRAYVDRASRLAVLAHDAGQLVVIPGVCGQRAR